MDALASVVSAITPSGGVTSQIAVSLLNEAEQAQSAAAQILLSSLGVGQTVSTEA